MEAADASNRTRARLLAVGVLFAAGAILLSMALDGAPDHVPHLSEPAVGDRCDPMDLVDVSGEPLNDADLIRLNSNRFLRARLCAPSVINLSAEGTGANGVGARLAIHLGSQVLFDEPIVGTVDIEATVRQPGWLLIAFNNDYYEPPADRNLLIRDLRIEPMSAPESQ